MPVYGDLATVGLTDLLQWVGMSQQTGVLELERNGVTKRIEFRKGFISSCCSSDRPNQLGQFLLNRGRITQEQLDAATNRLQDGGQRLGWVLFELGLMSEQDVARFVVASVEETMQVLFDWRGAAFRFYQGATFGPQQVEVSLPVSDVLLRGIQFQDELKRFREVFESSGVVLRRTDRPGHTDVYRWNFHHENAVKPTRYAGSSQGTLQNRVYRTPRAPAYASYAQVIGIGSAPGARADDSGTGSAASADTPDSGCTGGLREPAARGAARSPQHPARGG